MQTLSQDIRFAARILRTNPGFTAAAILTLALGIGANSTIFSVIDNVLLRPLPYKDPERLTLLWDRMENTGARKMPISLPEIDDFREQSSLFEDFAGMAKVSDGVLTGGGDPQHLFLGEVTHNFFSLLGTNTLIGRTFLPEDAINPPDLDAGPDADGPPNLVILSYAMWQRQFGGDSQAIDRVVRINGRSSIILGALPPDFEILMPVDAGMSKTIDAWVAIPFNASNRERALRDEDADDTGAVIGRLKPGVTLAQAQAEMDTIAAWQRQNDAFHHNAGTHIDVYPMHDDVVAHARPVLRALLGAVGFVLLIACINVANLLMARATGREREMALRAALGASRARVFRQVLTESVLLATLGAAFGLLLTFLGLRLLKLLQPANLPRIAEIHIDASVLGFTLGATLLATLFFGAVPALDATLRRGPELLRERGASSGSHRRPHLRSLLVICEVALSMALLIGTGLLLRSFVRLQEVRPGFEPSGALAFNLSLRDPVLYRGPRDRNDFSLRLEERLQRLPGVEAVGLVSRLPLSGRISTRQYGLEGQEPEVWSANEANYRVVTPGYFQAIGTRLLAGRLFTRADDSEDYRVAIIDQKLAERISNSSGRDAVGSTLGFPLDGRRRWAEVVGVVEHIRHESLRQDSRETIYVPYRHEASRDVSVVVRTSGDPATLIAPVRRELEALDKDLPVYGLRTMESYVERSMTATRFTLVAVGLFAILALVLASVGLYGVIAYGVRQRTQEIGIRMALGAQRSQLIGQVVGRGMALSGLGLLCGVFCSLAVSRGLESFLFQIGSADPGTYVLVSAVLAALTLLACYLPARQASRTNPIEVLRCE